jgi:hypothetical protein
MKDLDTTEGLALHIFTHWRKERMSNGEAKSSLRNLGLIPEVRPEYDLIRAYNPKTEEWIEENFK